MFFRMTTPPEPVPEAPTLDPPANPVAQPLLLVSKTEYGTWPTQAYEMAAGTDLYADDDYHIPPHGTEKIGTGLFIRLPPGYFGLIYDKSGLALRYGLTTRGCLDPDFRGVVSVPAGNISRDYISIRKGQAVAQLICLPYVRPKIIRMEKLPEDPTQRGGRGFGSSMEL